MLNAFKEWLFNVKTGSVLVIATLLLVLTGCSLALNENQGNAIGQQHNEDTYYNEASISNEIDAANAIDESSTDAEHTLVEQKPLTSFSEVAGYLRQHHTLPPNFMTKEKATELGWIASEGNLHEVAPGMSIGGNRFGNREGLLPKAKNRQYFEADIDYNGGRRNAKRIVYSNDGLIFMTTDHYNSFTDITEEGSVINDN